MKLTVTDGAGDSASTTKSVTVELPPVNAAPADVYGKQVYQDNPWAYYRLNDASRSATAKDFGPDARNGTYNSTNTITYGTAGALVNTTDKSITTNGSSGFATSPSTGTAPTTFSIEVWFKTTSTQGGRLIGYGSSSSGLSTNYDRMIYLQNTGQLVFGAYNGAETTVQSPAGTAYNNGAWHLATATMSADRRHEALRRRRPGGLQPERFGAELRRLLEGGRRQHVGRCHEQVPQRQPRRGRGLQLRADPDPDRCRLHRRLDRDRPARLLDAGCAIGLLVETLRDRGVDARGVDISDYAIGRVPDASSPIAAPVRLPIRSTDASI